MKIFIMDQMLVCFGSDLLAKNLNQISMTNYFGDVVKHHW